MSITTSFCLECGTPTGGPGRYCAACGATVTGPGAPPATEVSPAPHLARGLPADISSDDTGVSLPAFTGDALPRVTPAPPYASVARRFLGQVVDGLVAFGVVLIVGALVANRTGASDPAGAAGPAGNGFSLSVSGLDGRGYELTGGAALAALAITVAVALLYCFIAEAATGATLGKLAAGIRVRGIGGQRAGPRASAIRNLLRLVDGIGGYLIGGIVALNSPRKQRLGDTAAGTVVLRHPTAVGPRIGGALAAVVLAAAGIGGCWAVRDPTGVETIAMPSPTIGTPASGATASAPPSARIGGPLTVTLTRLINGSAEPLQPATTFAPNQGRIYAAFVLSGADQGTVVKAVWSAVNVSAFDPPNKKLGESEDSPEDGERNAFYIGSGSEPWPVGEYKVEFFIDDQLAVTVPFRIAP
jgi:uncharacterized RDD family membrane protein YckC